MRWARAGVLREHKNAVFVDEGELEPEDDESKSPTAFPSPSSAPSSAHPAIIFFAIF